MASKVRHIRSSVPGKIPAPEQLETGQLALNTADGKVFLKKSDGSVQDITKQIFQNNTSVTVNDANDSSLGTVSILVDGVEKLRVSANGTELNDTTSIENAKQLILKELTASGADGVSIKAPDTLAASYSITLPAAPGTTGQVLITDNSGQLSFRDSDIYGGNRIYVSEESGDDLNDGVSAPVRSVKRATQLASAMVYTAQGIPNGKKISVQVAAGNYVEDNPIIVPDNVVIKGDGLRSCIIRPLNPGQDMLRVRNGCYFAEFTFRDNVDVNFVPQFTFDYCVSFDDPDDVTTSRVGYTNLPTTKPTITTSPYIQNCSLISFLGGNGVKIDGNLVNTPNIPKIPIEAENPVSGPIPEQGKSMVSNAFTMLSFGGTGWRVVNEAYAQIVSCFQIFMLNGVYAQSGGYVSITNSATNFGLYALRSSGYNPGAFTFDRAYVVETGTSGSDQTVSIIGLGRLDPVEEFVLRFRDPQYKLAYDLLLAAKADIQQDTVDWIDAQIAANVGNPASIWYGFVYDSVKCFRDVGLIVDAIAYDVYSGGNAKSVEAGLSYYNGVVSLIAGQEEQTIAAIDYAKSLAQAIVAAETTLSTYTGDRFDIVTDIINDPGSAPETLSYSSVSDVTNTYKPAATEVTFNAATAVNATTNIFTIVGHGFNNADAVIYDSDSNPAISGLDDEQTYYIKFISVDEFSLTFDESLQYDADVKAVGSGTHKFIKNSQEFYVKEILESHDVYQSLVLDPGTYNFVPGRLITGSTSGNPNSAYVYSYDALTRTLIVSINLVTIGASTIRNQFNATSVIAQDHSSPSAVTNIGVSSTATVTGKGSSRFIITSTLTGGTLTTVGLPENEVWFHRPSVVNSSSHTWEYAGSGIDYNALPQNGGNTKPQFEQFEELPGRVYTSGTNELGDFKVGDFITAFNRTGNITFRNKVTVEQLDALRLSLSNVEITEISTNVNLGDNEIGGPSNSRLSTQLAVRSFLSNRLGNFIDKSVSTNAVPGALVQLNTNGQINDDLIPATRAFQSTITKGYRSRLTQIDFIPAVDLSAGDIATEDYQQYEITLDGTVTGNDGDIVLQATSGATGYLKGDYVASTNILVASIGATFDVAFNTTNTISIAGVGTGRTPTLVAPVSDISENYFLRSSTESQYLIVDPSASYSFTNASISTIARDGSNVATIVTSAAHNLTANSTVRITCSTDPTFNKITKVTIVNGTTFTYASTGSVVGTTSATGTVNSVVNAADTSAQGEVTETRYGVCTNVDNINITGGSLYTPSTGSVTYENVALTSVTGVGTGARADITVVDGEVNSVDLIRGGTGYAVGDLLSASAANIGGTGSGFEIEVQSIEKRVYVNIIGGELFVASSGSVDFVNDNNAPDFDITLTDTLAKTFNAADSGSGGDVDYATNRITITSHGYTNGDPVTYTSSPNVAIGGLINGQVYYVKVISSSVIELYEDYALLDLVEFLSSSTGTHSVTRRVVNTVDNSLVIVSHGFTTGDAIVITGSDLPTIEGDQIPATGQYYFVGSVTTNSFTLHSLRSDAMSSINGLTINPEDIETAGTGSANVLKNNVKVIGILNTSSRNIVNWNSLAVTNIDASNIISGTISTSRLASSGTANTDTFLRGDSSWAVAVQTIAEGTDSPITLTGSNVTGEYYGDVIIDIDRVSGTLGDATYTNPGVAKFNKNQFDVGIGGNIGQVFIKDGVIDAGTLDTYDSSYFLNPTNLTSAVPANKGGTGLFNYTEGDIIYAQTGGTLTVLNISVPDSVMTSTGTAPQWSTGLTLAKNITLASGDLATGSVATATLFNENTKAVNIAGAAPSVAIGNNSASESLTTAVASYTASTSTTVTVNLTGTSKTTTTISSNGATELRFSNTTNIKIGQLVTGSASIPAGVVVIGMSSTSVYLSQALIGSIGSATSLTFTETPRSLGIKVGDQITIASSAVANLDGTWPVIAATANATSFNIQTATNVTAASVPRAGTIEKLNSLLIRNRTVAIGSTEHSATPVAATIRGENGLGTNIVGGTLTLQPGLSTGSASGGNFVVKTGVQTSSGSAQQAATTRLTIDNQGNSIFTTVVEVQNTIKANHSTGITTDQITFPLVDTTATTVNFARAATAIVIGATTGTTTVRNKLIVSGDLQVDGTTITVNSTTVTIDDPIFNLGGDTAPVSDDNKDRGISYSWHNGSSAKVGFFGYDDSKAAFTFIPDATISSEVASGTVGQILVGSVNLNDHAVTSTTETTGITSAAAVAVDSWDSATYRSGKYMLQVTCTAGTDANQYQTSEILVIHNGSVSTLTDYAVIRTGNNLVTFTTDISGSNVRLLAQATAGNTVKVKLTRTIQTV